MFVKEIFNSKEELIDVYVTFFNGKGMTIPNIRKLTYVPELATYKCVDVKKKYYSIPEKEIDSISYTNAKGVIL